MEWNDMPDDEYEDLARKISDMTESIKEPLTDDQIADIVEVWQLAMRSYIEIDVEYYHIGRDGDGYVVVAHLTPTDNNPKNAFYTLSKHETYKRYNASQYRTMFISSFIEEDDDDDDDDDDVELIIDDVGDCNNYLSAIEDICIHWHIYNEAING